MGKTFGQKNVTPAAVPSGPPYIKMPTNNVTGQHTKVNMKTGTTHSSQFAKPGANPGSKHPGKHNLPTKNSPSKSVPLGTTKHAAGEVPAYLKRSK